MTTFTVNIEDDKAEKAVKAFLDALELKYKVDHSNIQTRSKEKPLSKKAQKLYDGIKNSLEDIKKWERGEIELKDAKDFLNEL